MAWKGGEGLTEVWEREGLTVVYKGGKGLTEVWGREGLKQGVKEGEGKKLLTVRSSEFHSFSRQ